MFAHVLQALVTLGAFPKCHDVMTQHLIPSQGTRVTFIARDVFNKLQFYDIHISRNITPVHSYPFCLLLSGTQEKTWFLQNPPCESRWLMLTLLCRGQSHMKVHQIFQPDRVILSLMKWGRIKHFRFSLNSKHQSTTPRWAPSVSFDMTQLNSGNYKDNT